MRGDEGFCDVCNVALDLHDYEVDEEDKENCDRAEDKANFMNDFFRRILA